MIPTQMEQFLRIELTMLEPITACPEEPILDTESFERNFRRNRNV